MIGKGNLCPGTPRRTQRSRWLRATARTATTAVPGGDRKSTRLNSSHSQISYAVLCLKKKKCPGGENTSDWHTMSMITRIRQYISLPAMVHATPLLLRTTSYIYFALKDHHRYTTMASN